MDDEIEQMKEIYKTVDELVVDCDYIGIDNYINSLMDSSVTFQLCTAVLTITKNIDYMLSERNKFLEYSVYRARIENIPDYIIDSALDGIA